LKKRKQRFSKPFPKSNTKDFNQKVGERRFREYLGEARTPRNEKGTNIQIKKGAFCQRKKKSKGDEGRRNVITGGRGERGLSALTNRKASPVRRSVRWKGESKEELWRKVGTRINDHLLPMCGKKKKRAAVGEGGRGIAKPVIAITGSYNGSAHRGEKMQI